MQARPDFSPAAQAAAATGQPLMAAQSGLPSAGQVPQYTAVQYMQPQVVTTPGGGMPQMYHQVNRSLAVARGRRPLVVIVYVSDGVYASYSGEELGCLKLIARVLRWSESIVLAKTSRVRYRLTFGSKVV